MSSDALFLARGVGKPLLIPEFPASAREHGGRDSNVRLFAGTVWVVCRFVASSLSRALADFARKRHVRASRISRRSTSGFPKARASFALSVWRSTVVCRQSCAPSPSRTSANAAALVRPVECITTAARRRRSSGSACNRSAGDCSADPASADATGLAGREKGRGEGINPQRLNPVSALSRGRCLAGRTSDPLAVSRGR